MTYRRIKQLDFDLKDLSNLPHPSTKSKLYLPFPFPRKRFKTLNHENATPHLEPKLKLKLKDKSKKYMYFDSQDQYIKNILISEGWVLKRNVIDCHLIWTYNLSKIIYSPQSHQKCNHFKDSYILTSKEELKNTLMNNSSSQMKINSFYSRTYHIQNQFIEFKNDYFFTAILIILKKLIVYIQPSITLHKQKKKQKEIDFNKFMGGEGETKFEQTPDPSLLVPKHLLLYSILILQKYRRLREGTMDNNQSNLFHASEQIIYQLVEFSRSNPPYDNYNSLMLGTPCKTLVCMLVEYYSYYSEVLPYYQSDGFNNIWIVKHSEGSRGRTIQLIQSPCQIKGGNHSSKLVQKYIENIWIFNENQLKGYTCEQIPRQLYRLVDKKFDIRIWVLVTKTEPLVAYMFEEGVIRISSESYNVSKIKNYLSHLTNYSINKQNYNNKQQSYVLLSSLVTHLIKKYNHTKLMKDIEEVVVKTLECCDFQRCNKNNSQDENAFELFGFDFLLDNNLSPWLLEVNMSPACKTRGTQDKDLEKVKQKMARGMLEILGLIDMKANPKSNKGDCNKRWIKVTSDSKQQIITCKDKLQVVGRNFNKIQLQLAERNIQKLQAAVKIQRFIRTKILIHSLTDIPSRQRKLIARVKPFIAIVNKIIGKNKKSGWLKVLTLGKISNSLVMNSEVKNRGSSFVNYRKRITSKCGAKILGQKQNK